MDSLQQYHTHPDAMRGATRKKQNSLMHKELNNFERVISHALGRFKLDMWYDMLSQIVPEDMEVNSLAALQDIVQSEKKKIRKAGEEPGENIVVMYFRDFFRDVGQLRQMKDIFHVRIYSVLFEYYYDVDSIQEISDIAKSSEEKNSKEVNGMSKLKNRNLSKVQKGDSESRFPPEVVSELADDCVEISGLIGELKRLDFSWGRLLNDPEIEAQLFSTGSDDQFKEYDNYQHFEGVFKFVPDVLQKCHQAIVLARNWWFKAEKIHHRLSKIKPPPSSTSRQATGNMNKPQAGTVDDSQDFNDSEDEPLQDGEFDEEKLEYSGDEIFGEDDIMEDYGDNTLSDEEDMFKSSDPGAIVIEKHKTPVNKDDDDDDDEIENKYFDNQKAKMNDSDSRGTYTKVGFDDEYESQDERDTDTEVIEPDNDLAVQKNETKPIRTNAKVKNVQPTPRGRNKANTVKKTKATTYNATPPNKPKNKKPPKKSKPAKPAKASKNFATEATEEFAAEATKQFANEANDSDNDEQIAKEKLQELNANIDAHQRDLDIQIEELKNLCDRNQRVKTLCESLEDTIESQVSQRKKAQELMTVKESLEELKEQDTTTPEKERKVQKHLDKINKELDELLKSENVKEYQSDLLKEDLDLQLAVSPRLVSYGNEVQGQIESLEDQLEQEKQKLAQLQREYNVMSRRSRIENKRHQRLKVAEADGKSFSADAVNKSRRADVLRNKDAQKPTRHSDGSAGETPRDGHLSASSGSVFLNEGDVDLEEYNDDESDEEIGELEDNGELLGDDSGVGEPWEEIGKASSEFPRTPAPPQKSKKQVNKSTGRPVKQRQVTQPRTTNKRGNKQEPQRQLASNPTKGTRKSKESRPTKDKSGRNDDGVDQSALGKPPTKGTRKKESPRKTSRAVKDKQALVDEQYDQEDDDLSDDAGDDEDDEPNQDQETGPLETEPSGHGLFGTKYRYPISDTETSDEDDLNQSRKSSNAKTTSNSTALTSDRQKKSSSHGKQSKSDSKKSNKVRSNKQRQAAKEVKKEVAQENDNDEYDSDQEEQTEQLNRKKPSKSNSKQPNTRRSTKQRRADKEVTNDVAQGNDNDEYDSDQEEQTEQTDRVKQSKSDSKQPNKVRSNKQRQADKVVKNDVAQEYDSDKYESDQEEQTEQTDRVKQSKSRSKQPNKRRSNKQRQAEEVNNDVAQENDNDEYESDQEEQTEQTDRVKQSKSRSKQPNKRRSNKQRHAEEVNNDVAQENDNDEYESDQEEQTEQTDRVKQSKSDSKQPNKRRSNKQRHADKEVKNNVAQDDTSDNDEYESEQEEQTEQTEQVTEDLEQEAETNKTSHKPPMGNKKNQHQPKPPTTNKSNKTRTRARAPPVETNTSDEEAQDQPENSTNRASRSKEAPKAKRGRSQSRGMRSQSRGRAGKEAADKTEEGDDEGNQRKEKKEKTGGLRRTSKVQEAKKNARPSWKSTWKK